MFGVQIKGKYLPQNWICVFLSVCLVFLDTLAFWSGIQYPRYFFGTNRWSLTLIPTKVKDVPDTVVKSWDNGSPKICLVPNSMLYARMDQQSWRPFILELVCLPFSLPLFFWTLFCPTLIEEGKLGIVRHSKNLQCWNCNQPHWWLSYPLKPTATSLHVCINAVKPWTERHDKF